ncbi:MAG: HAD family hydrolase [Candidatus Ornithospirochaeta sp.]|nr:HAD family hydrolase [Candidatus Ornithospirochaeta sp.]
MKCIFTDIDGTLLRSDKSLSRHTAEVLDRFVNEGNRLVLASGRCIDGLECVFSLLSQRPFLASLNGAYIETPEGECIFSSALDKDILLEIHEDLCRLGLGYLYFTGRQWGADPQGIDYSREKEIVRKEGIRMGLRDILSVRDINKFLIVGDNLKISRYAKELAMRYPELNIMQSSPVYIEINSKDADKGKAVKRVADHLGIDLDDVYAFGDYDNDISMLSSVRHSVAMANASPAALRSANERTLSNDEDGVADYIERNLI